MKELHRSIYAKHLYDPENQTLYSEWFESTAKMTEAEFKQEMEKWAEVSVSCSPLYIYDYCVNFVYPISIENQTWLAHLLNPTWANLGVKKYAHIVPAELIANLSVEQMFDEFLNMNLPNQFEIKHFSEEKEGKDWLNQQ